MQEEFVPPTQLDRLGWLAVDFDGTLCESTWSPDNPHAQPGPPIQENVDELRRCVELGWKITIHTSRGWADYNIIEAWLNHYDVPFRRIVCGKLLAHRYIDDRNAMLGTRWV